jgi:predicted dehydrogenase
VTSARGGWRWGIAGPGGIAGQFADAMTMVDDGRIVAVASRAAERAEAFGAKHGIPGRYDDYRALADDPDVDVVYVATPHSRHEADTLLYLEAGKHVLCEKPLALNAHQGRRMAAAARASGRFLMEAVWSRFLPAYRALGDVLAEGRIGRPLLVEGDFGFGMPVMPDYRLFDRAQGGGALLDLGIYPLQLASFVLGTPELVAADGSVGSTGVDELVVAMLRHPDDGKSVVKAAIRTNLACTARISGTDGWIDLPAFMHCPHWIAVSGSGRVDRIEAGYEGEGLRFEIAAVHRHLDDGLLESPVMPLDESILLATTMDAIRQRLGVTYPGESTD